MAAPGKDTDPVVVEEEAPRKEEPGIEVPLEKEAPTEPSLEDRVAEKVKRDFEALYAGRIEQLENRLRGSWRINEKLERDSRELRESVNKLQRPGAPPVTPDKDELDALVEKGDWKTAVGKIADQRAEALYQQRVALEQQQAQLLASQQTLERSKNSVVEKYPDLDPDTGDPESETSRAYAAELNKDPSLLSNMHGPEIAMYRMEQTVNPNGKSAGTETPNTEVVRRQRAGQGSLPASRSIPGTNKVVISRDQKEFIDYHGIDPTLYAQMQKALETDQQVEA